MNSALLFSFCLFFNLFSFNLKHKFSLFLKSNFSSFFSNSLLFCKLLQMLLCFLKVFVRQKFLSYDESVFWFLSCHHCSFVCIVYSTSIFQIIFFMQFKLCSWIKLFLSRIWSVFKIFIQSFLKMRIVIFQIRRGLSI